MNKNASAKQVRSRITDQFLRFNRKLLFAVSEVPHELTVNESQVVSFIEISPGSLSRDLAESLQLDKSTVSRVIASLYKRGVLEEREGAEDRRTKRLYLSEVGVAQLQRDSEARNLMTLRCVEGLSDSQRHELVKLLHRLADNLGATSINTRPDDNPLKIAIRRLTRSMGFLGARSFGSEVPIEIYQILNLVGNSKDNGITVAALNLELPYERTTTSHHISHLRRLGLLSKSRSKLDSRQFLIRLTEKGKKHWIRALEGSGRLLEIGLRSFTDDEINQLQSLLAKFLENDLFLPVGKQHNVGLLTSINSELEKQSARAFIVRYLIGLGIERRTPATLMLEPCITIGLYGASNHQLTGVCEFVPNGKDWQMNYLICDSSIEAKELLRACLERIFLNKKISKVSILSGSIGYEKLEPLLSDSKLIATDGMITRKHYRDGVFAD